MAYTARARPYIQCARENGWPDAYVDSEDFFRGEFPNEVIAMQQKMIIGAPEEGAGTAFGGRFLISNQEEIHIAHMYPSPDISHHCDLYYLPAEGRIFATCMNQNFTCRLGDRSRIAFEAGDLSLLPKVEEVA